MQEIKFIAKPTREKPEYSTEDVNDYEVRYNPPRGRIFGTSGGTFSSLLLEAVCELPIVNPHKDRINVSLEGNFPRKYLDELKTVFDFYSQAEDVVVNVE